MESETVKQEAEGEGFEPPVGFPTHVFKTCALSRSAIPPKHPNRAPHSNTLPPFIQDKMGSLVFRAAVIGLIFTRPVK